MRTVLHLLSLIGIVLAQACTTVVQGGSSQSYSPILLHTKVIVVNNCSAEADLELGGQVVKTGLKYGESFTVVITRPMLSAQYGTERLVTFKARMGETYLGSSTRRYRIDANRSGSEEIWEVASVRTANGGGGCRS